MTNNPIEFTVSRDAFHSIVKEMSGLAIEKDIPLERLEPGRKTIENVYRIKLGLESLRGPEGGGCRLALTSVSHGVRIERVLEVNLDGPLEAVSANFVLDMSLLYTILNNKRLTKTIRCVIDANRRAFLIRSGKTEYVLEFKDSSDIPDAPAYPEIGDVAKIRAGDLLRLIESVKFAAANSRDRRPELAGVHIHTDGDLLVAVAMNGPRLARYAIPSPGALDLPDGVTIPNESLPHIKRFLEGVGELFEIGIHVDATKLWLVSAEARLLTCLVDGIYPDYKRVASFDPCPVSLDYAGFRQAVDQCATFSDRSAIVLSKAEDELCLKVESSGIHGSAEVLIDYDGEVGFGSHVGFNANYMLDVLNLGREIAADFGDGFSPIRLHGALDTELWAVIVPMLVGPINA